MENFDIIEFGYDIGDETINFGTRLLADDDNLYEACTLATLKCSDQSTATANPHVNAMVKNDRIYFSINSSIRVFGNKNCSDIIYNISFDTIIDTFQVSPNGRYIIVCLRSGEIIGIDLDKDTTPFFSQSVKRETDDAILSQPFFDNCFFEDDQVNTSFLIITKKGTLHRIVIEHDGATTLEMIFDFSFSIKSATYTVHTLVVDGPRMACYNLDSNNLIFGSPCDSKKLFPLGLMVLALDDRGSILRVCIRTLQKFPVHNEIMYKDLVFVSSPKQRQFIALTDDNIQLLSYPGFSPLYSLKEACPVDFIIPECTNDEVLYISKIVDKSDHITELRFRMVCESEPLQRLERLITKRKYEEAEKFAKQFNLDLEIINKAKVEVITEKTHCDNSDIEQLITLLNSITDDRFKLNSCLDVATFCDSLNDVRRILNYGSQVASSTKNLNQVEIEIFQKSIAHLLFRCDTFILLYPEDLETAALEWRTNYDSNLFETLQMFLNNCKIEKANIIYNRLDEATRNGLTIHQIRDILEILNRISVDLCLQFLPIFIPNTLAVLPDAFSLFVTWCRNKICRLESVDKAHFPDNAITLAQAVVRSIKDHHIHYLHPGKPIESIEELTQLLQGLFTLKTLKDDYKISISMQDYLAGARTMISRLLNTTAMSHINYNIFIQKFLLKYIYENYLDPNTIFYTEIITLIEKYEERDWILVVPSILNCINAVDVKLETVIKILDLATVPWCNAIRQMVEPCLQYTHPLVDRIKTILENEQIQIVLSRPKYEIREKVKTINSEDLLFFTKRILYCKEPTMEDDVYKLCKTLDNRHQVNMLLIFNYIRLGDDQSALRILDNNTDEEIFRCTQELLICAESAMNENYQGKLMQVMRETYYDIAGSIVKRLNKNIPSDFQRSCNDDTLNLIKNVSNLKKYFQITTTTYDLRNDREKGAILDDILDNTWKDLLAEKLNVENLFLICNKISICLSMTSNEVLLKFCAKCQDYSIIVKIAENLYENEFTSKNLCLIAVLLFKYGDACAAPVAANETFPDLENLILRNSRNIDIDLFCEGLALAEKIVTKALVQAQPDDITACVEVMHWINSSFYLRKVQDNRLRKILFENVQDVVTTQPKFSAICTVKNIFNLFCTHVGFLNEPQFRYLTYFNDLRVVSVDDEFLREINMLKFRVEEFCKERQYFTAFKIVLTLHNSLLNLSKPSENMITLVDDVLKKTCIPKILKAILSNEVVDCDLLYNLLLVCDKEYSYKFIELYLKTYKRDISKFKNLLKMACRFWDYHNITQSKSVIISSLLTVKWWNKYELNKLYYDKFFKLTPKQRIEWLIENNYIDVESIREYCNDFHLDLNYCYTYMLSNIIVNWQPDYEIEDLYGTRKLLMKNNEKDLYHRCTDVIKFLDPKEVIMIIENIWNSTNFYYYEIYITLLNIRQELEQKVVNVEQKLKVLLFLKNYRRSSKPSETEIEQWYSTFPDTQSVDPLSEFRLPFTPFFFTHQIWDIIKPEINLKTYDLWFGVIDIVNGFLNKDDICLYAVKNVITGELNEADDAWVLYPQHQHLFDSIEKCMQNVGDLEKGTSVMYYLMTHTPRGADQLCAAALCYKYAKNYKSLNSDYPDVEVVFTKVEKKYFSCHATHILYKYQLAEKKYIDLVAQPTKLIVALYSDERILQQDDPTHLRCPDFNEAIEELAELFSVDIMDLKVTLIENWVLTAIDLDSSLVVMSSSYEEDNLKRAVYICHKHKDFWQQFLLKEIDLKAGLHVVNVKAKLNYDSTLRALKVFIAISDREAVSKLTSFTYDEIINLIERLTLICNLHSLGIMLNCDELEQYDKKKLLNDIALRGTSALAIKSMGILCMTYKIYNIKCWRSIFNVAVQLSMFVELRAYIDFLHVEKFYYMDFYINACQKVVDNAFAMIDTLQGDELEKVLLNNFQMIQSCPALNSLNFKYIFKKCIYVGKTEYGAVLLQYFDKTDRDILLKDISGDRDLIKLLEKLEMNGVCGISAVKSIVLNSP